MPSKAHICVPVSSKSVKVGVIGETAQCSLAPRKQTMISLARSCLRQTAKMSPYIMMRYSLARVTSETRFGKASSTEPCPGGVPKAGDRGN
jgi:hypothetical protein